MKDTIIWAKQTYEMEWLEEFDNSLLNNLKQVYGFLFDKSGKLVIITDDPKRTWTLPGGGPEPEDGGWEDTMIREAMEEADVVLDPDSLKIVGIIKVTPKSNNCEYGVHYLLRVVGKITNTQDQTKDPCRDAINYREFIEPKDFNEFVKWGKFGEYQMEKALNLWQN